MKENLVMKRKISEKAQILEDLTICPGTGATLRVGSDSYPYWITEVCPNRVFGICHAKSHFDEKHPWQGGTQVVEEYDPKINKTDVYIKRCYGHWWVVTKDGKERLRRFDDRWRHFSIGEAESYKDPSF